MKKIILSAAILLGLSAMSVSAKEVKTDGTATVEQTAGNKAEMKHKKHHGKMDRKAGKTRMAHADKMKDRKVRNPFEGLNLTESQLTQLEAIKTDMKAQRKADMEKAKAEGKKERKDAAARKAEKQQMKDTYLAKVKSILTQEQYVTFLENNYKNTKSDAFKGKAPKKNKFRGDRESRKGKKNACCNEVKTDATAK